jgi:hypothetical protein
VEEGKHGLRSSVLYLHEATVMTRMTRERLEDALATTHRHPEMYVSEYLSHCWIPRRLFDAWLVKYGLPEDPPRFRPKLPPLQKAKRGRPVEYNWLGVGPKIKDYVSQNGPMKTFDELLQKCMDFARDLHPKGKTPDESTTKKAIEKYKLRVIARLGKMQRKSGER